MGFEDLDEKFVGREIFVRLKSTTAGEDEDSAYFDIGTLSM